MTTIGLASPLKPAVHVEVDIDRLTFRVVANVAGTLNYDKGMLERGRGAQIYIEDDKKLETLDATYKGYSAFAYKEMVAATLVPEYSPTPATVAKSGPITEWMPMEPLFSGLGRFCRPALTLQDRFKIVLVLSAGGLTAESEWFTLPTQRDLEQIILLPGTRDPDWGSYRRKPKN